MTIIEDEPRALQIIEPVEVARLSNRTPTDTIGLATEMATALKDIVEKQKLYAVIQGKKYPQVEAWMTIARMDNVVAREMVGGVVRQEDGSYESTVELIRLSDGMVVGRGSALCGVKGDKPWDTRAEPARRSMAVTRATSRAFRQQYSWIMALAGYEPTPAEEMPRDEPAVATAPERLEPQTETHDGGLIGTAEIGKGKADFERREGPTGAVVSFRLVQGRKGFQVIAEGPLAEALLLIKDEVVGKRVIVWGSIEDQSFQKGEQTITYKVVKLERIQTPSVILPATIAEPVEAESVPLPFTDEEAAAIVAQELAEATA